MICAMLTLLNVIDQSALQCGEADAQAIPAQLVHRHLRAQLPAGVADRLNAAAPAFDIPGAIKHIGDVRIVGHGVVRLHQRVHRPALRQDAAVADDHGLILDADLDRRAEHIAVVRDGVIDCLADRLAGKGIGLCAPVMLEADLGLQIFQINQVDDLVRGREQ